MARAEQNLESVRESESEHSSMRTIIDLHQDHDDSVLNQSDTDNIIIRSLTTDLKSPKVRIIY